MNGILADANCEGHLALLLRLFQEGWRYDVWEILHPTPLSLTDLGLQPDPSDREVWAACQREQVILLTANRNDDGPESLEATILGSTPLGEGGKHFLLRVGNDWEAISIPTNRPSF